MNWQFIIEDSDPFGSDGLTNMVKEEEIYNIIKENDKEACNKLVEKANENGGLDNISVIIISNKD